MDEETRAPGPSTIGAVDSKKFRPRNAAEGLRGPLNERAIERLRAEMHERFP